jgi:hypothetical protein
MLYLDLNFRRRRIKMIKNSLPNNRNPKSEREANAAVLKTLFPSINLKDELCSSIFYSYYYMV